VQLKGKRALIAGSTSGIEITEALALNGCDIVLDSFGSSVEAPRPCVRSDAYPHALTVVYNHS
jgi:hypothetical protein